MQPPELVDLSCHRALQWRIGRGSDCARVGHRSDSGPTGACAVVRSFEAAFLQHVSGAGVAGWARGTRTARAEPATEQDGYWEYGPWRITADLRGLPHRAWSWPHPRPAPEVPAQSQVRRWGCSQGVGGDVSRVARTARSLAPPAAHGAGLRGGDPGELTGRPRPDSAEPVRAARQAVPQDVS